MCGKRLMTVLTSLLVLTGAIALQVPAAVAQAPAATTDDIIDVPVSFTVENVNRSESQCSSDGETYTIRGHLTAPASVLDEVGSTVTLYVHGTNTGEWIWRLNVDGYNYVQALAERGHASVTIDRLGYGSSDLPTPNGFASCTGAHADIAHQIVQQLRDGSYDVEGRASTPFSRVFMAGHSSGALLAEIVAYSFGGVDGIILTGWAAIGLTEETIRRFFVAYEWCLAGGQPISRSDEPDGYVFFDQTREDFLAGGLSLEADPRVSAAVASLHSRNPCGVMVSEPMAILMDLDRLDEIQVPVYLVFGEKDVLRQGVASYPSFFTGSDDVTDMTVRDAGHFLTIDVNASTVYDGVADWLDQHQ